MNSLAQYIELYNRNISLVNDGSTDIMNRMRPEALDILNNTELPKKGSENFETTDLNEILSPDYGINLARVQLNVNAGAAFQCGIPNMTKTLFFFRNDLYTETSEARKELPDGLFIGSLKKFCREYPVMAEKYYGKTADIRNPLVALNTLLAQDGIVVWAKEGVRYDKPIQIVGILENEQPLMAIRRLLIIAEKNSDIKVLLCDHTQTDNVRFLNLVTTEIVTEENSKVEICEMEESSEVTSRLSCVYLRQGKSSHVSSSEITLYNGVTRNEYYCEFGGPNAHLDLSGMAIEDNQRKVDTYSRVNHIYPGCTTNELFKYVVDDNAVAAFSGVIKVFKGASKTEAFQNNRNIIGSDGARIYSKPTLEIYDDDVKCSHGSAIGQLDEKQIFYMRTRGLTEGQARFLLKQAFMSDVIDRIAIPDFKLRLHSLVEKRFAGEPHNCSACKNIPIKND